MKATILWYDERRRAHMKTVVPGTSKVRATSFSARAYNEEGDEIAEVRDWYLWTLDSDEAPDGAHETPVVTGEVADLPPHQRRQTP